MILFHDLSIIHGPILTWWQHIKKHASRVDEVCEHGHSVKGGKKSLKATKLVTKTYDT